MPEYLTPGVYVEENRFRFRPIEALPTSTAGFVGETARGPIEPRPLTGYAEFVGLYGSLLPPERSYLSYAVRGYFENGGKRCFIGRVVSKDAVPARAEYDGKLSFRAAGPGSWGNRIAIKVEPGSAHRVDRGSPCFKLTVMYWDELPEPLIDPTDPAKAKDPNHTAPTVIEVFDNLTDVESSADFYERRAAASRLIRVASTGSGLPTEMDLTTLQALGDAGSDGSAIEPADFEGHEITTAEGPEWSGLRSMESIDEIAIVCAPDHHRDPGIADLVVDHCERLHDRFAVVHSTPDVHTLDRLTDIRPPRDTSFAAFYIPWIGVTHDQSGRDVMVPPSGHVAGVYARTDLARGVHKAPAGEVLHGVHSLQFDVGDREQDVLNPRGVNCIRHLPGQGVLVWGARTSSTHADLKYVSVRRMLLMIEESIAEGTQWVVFESNDEPTWARVRESITNFLMTLWRDGKLMGSKAEEAFFVKVDRTTMTQDDIDNGRLISVVGVAPVRPAEFVIFRVTQIARLEDLP